MGPDPGADFSIELSDGDTGANVERFRITENGNVGIGTTTPGELLDVRGNLRVGGSSTSNYIAFHGTTGDNPAGFNHGYIGERIFSGTESSELVIFKGNDVEGAPGPDRIRHIAANHLFDTYGSALSGTFAEVSASTVPTTKMIITQAGNVGIGTTSTDGKLTVVTDTRFNNGNGFRIQSSSDATRNLLFLGASSVDDASNIQAYKDGTGAGVRNLLLNALGGNVGIGTESPSTILNIRSATAQEAFLRLQSTDASGSGRKASVLFNLAGTDRGFIGFVDATANNFELGNAFTDGNTSIIAGNAERMRITSTGNVGIGTVAPGEKLEVVGTVKATQLNLDGLSVQDTATVTTTSTTQTALASYAIATYATGKFLIQATQGSIRQISELLVTHNGTTSTATEYGILKTGATLFNVTTDISGGNVRVLVTSTSATSTVYRTSFTLIGV
jgi:hypothetical protein